MLNTTQSRGKGQDPKNMGSTNKPVLSAQGVYKKFSSGDSAGNATGDLQILGNLNLQLVKSQSLAIVGASGSGKSTLLSLLAGLDLPDQGKIFIDGVDLTQLDETSRSSLRATKMSFVFQDFMLLPHLTAQENVMLPLEMRGVAAAKELATNELTKVGLADRMHHFPSQLSGGEQQRTALARAFVAKPLILFADEPNGNLDDKTSEQIVQLLFGMNLDNHTTLVLVTHDMKLAEKCDQIYELVEGQLKLIGGTQGVERAANAVAEQSHDSQASSSTLESTGGI